MSAELKVYCKNITTEIIGEENGLTAEKQSQTSNAAESAVNNVNKERNDGLCPYRDLPYIEDMVYEVKSVAENIRRKYENFVVLGGGLSAGGGIIIAEATNPNSAQTKLYSDFFTPSIEKDIYGWSDEKLSKTAFNIVALDNREQKAVETLDRIRKLLVSRCGIENAAGLFVTTNITDGDLSRLCSKYNIKNLQVQEGISEPLATFSQAGLLAAAVGGGDIEQLLAGARAIDLRCGNEDLPRNPAAITALAVNYAYINKAVKTLIPLNKQLHKICRWCCDLWQHSGEAALKAEFKPDLSPHTQDGGEEFFILIASTSDCCRNTPDADLLSKKLTENGKANISIQIDKLDCRNIGQLMYMMQVVISISKKLEDDI